MTLREHVSIGTKVRMSEDLVKFPSIAMNNVVNYINAKVSGDTVKLTPVFVTHKEEEEYCSLQNKSIEEIKIRIFRLIENLDDANAQLQREVFKKTVNRKKKERFIEFFLTVAEQIDYETVSNNEQNENRD